MGKTQTESLPYWPSGTDVNAAVPRFMILSASLSYVCHMQCFSGPIIGPWSLSENNVLELANQSTRYIVNKLNPMISRTNLYIFFTIQLCMYFMEGQERKIHWATMIKCSTMLLAGLIYWITCWILVVLKWMKKRSQVELYCILWRTVWFLALAWIIVLCFHVFMQDKIPSQYHLW